MPFTATTIGRDTLGLRSILEDFANEQWIPDHIDDKQRAIHWLVSALRKDLQPPVARSRLRSHLPFP